MPVAVMHEARSALLSEYLSLDEAAAELRVSRRSLVRWLTEGLAPPSLKLGNHRYFKRASLVTWLARKETASAPRRRGR